MKKQFLSILLSLCMVLMLFPVTVFTEEAVQETPVCTCETACAADAMNVGCAVCGAEGAVQENCGKYEVPAEDPVEDPAEDPVEAPTEDPAEAPAEDPAETPAEAPAVDPVEDPAEPTSAEQAQEFIDALPATEARDDQDDQAPDSLTQQYTITYLSDKYSTGSIKSGIKTHGVDCTLSSETFTRESYVQIGWSYTEGGWQDYALGDIYNVDKNLILYPVWDVISTLTADFTTTVKLGGNEAPGETVFTL